MAGVTLMQADAYLEALLSLPGLYGGKVSPDGKWVAWSRARTAPTIEVYAAPTDGSQKPVRLTDTPENTYFVSWIPDSSAVIVTQDKDGNEREQLFRVFIDKPLTMHPLTEADPNYFIHHGELHPNGNWLVYAANVDVDTGDEIEQSVVIRHNLETGERLTLAKPHKANYNFPQLSPTGEHVIYNRSDIHPSGDQMWLVGIDGANDHEILNAGDEVKTWSSWFPDGQRLLVMVETDTHRKIGVRTLDDDSIHWLLDDPRRNIEDAFVPHGSADIVIINVQNARIKATLLNPETGHEKPFPDLPGSLSPVAPLADGAWIGVYFSSKQPTDIVRFARDATSPDDLKSISCVWERTELTPDDMTAAEDFRWRSTDNLEIQGWLYRTKDKARGTVVYVHGGPTYHSSDAINNEIQYFVKLGFNVLDPNYRGSTGFNLAYREKIKEEGWGGMEQVDIRTGIETLIEQGIAEKGKVGITGTSYGGYSSWYAITHFNSDTLMASAPICGMTDLVVDYNTTRPDLRPYSEEMMGGTPAAVPERSYERSPVNFVQNIKGRLLIVQGMQDPNVHPDNVKEVREKLDTAGVEYGVLAFDDEGHGISKPKNQKTLYIELAQFFGSAFEGN
jgi:dipeptidyl aminopeptidase/acylaminoacyl peptidase